MTTATATQPKVTPIVADLDATTSQKALLAALQFIASVLPPRNILPVLAGVLIEGRGDELKVSAFDYEVSTTEIVAGAGTGRALIPGKTFIDFVKSIDKGAQVTMTIDDDKLVLTGDGVTYRIPTLALDEYPQLPDTTSATAVCGLGAEQLEGLLDVAVAAGRDGTLPVLTGLYFTPNVVTDGKRKTATLDVAATDRYRLAVYNTGVSVSTKLVDWRMLVPAPTVVKIAKSFKGGTVQLLSGGGSGEGEGLAVFTDGVRTITTRLLDGVFPKYKSLLPDHSETQATFDSKVLKKGIQQVAVAASRTSPVRLAITGSDTVLQAGGFNETEAEKRVDAGVTGPDVTMAFNPAYLLDGLTAISRDSVAVNIISATKPAVFTGVGREEFQYLLMPVRLAG